MKSRTLKRTPIVVFQLLIAAIVLSCGSEEEDPNLDNTSPTISAQSFSIEENSMNGTVVGTVSASDVETNNLTFIMTGGNTGDAFSIDVAGALTVNSVEALDFETNPSFALTIEVSDGTLTASAIITIGLTDMDESTPVDTSCTILTIIADDGDEILFDYDASGKLTSIENRKSDDMGGTSSDLLNFTYTDGKIVSAEYDANNTNEHGSYTIEYNSDDMVSKTTYIDTNGEIDEDRFIYSNGVISSVEYWDNYSGTTAGELVLNGTDEITISDNNVSKVKYTNEQDSDVGTDDLKYDSFNNPYYENIGWLVFSDIIIYYFSINNITELKSENSDGEAYALTVNYEYNSNNFPTKTSYIDGTETYFENATYNCN